MTIEETTTRLLEIGNSLKLLLPELDKLEHEYYNNYHGKLLNSGMGTIILKEAEAKQTLALEPIYDKYHNKKIELRILLHEKEILTEVSKNFRAIYARD